MAGCYYRGMTKTDFLVELMGNSARARLLRVFILNAEEPMTLAVAAKRAAVSPKAAAKEVRKLVALDIVKKGKHMTIKVGKERRAVRGSIKVDTWVADSSFKYFRALASFIHEISPVRHEAIVGALKKSGRVSAVILSGSFIGDDSRPADLLVALDSLNEKRVDAAVRSLEPAIGREIRYAAFTTPEFRYRLTVQDKLIRDTLDFPHLVLFDKTRML